MQLPVAKRDVRDTLAQLCAAGVVVLTFVAVATAWSLENAVNLVLLAAGGFLLARLAARIGARVPAPPFLHRARRAFSYRRMASDQPFQTRLGWTSDAEPGGPLPDVRRVTPYGRFGGGLYMDGFVGGLVVAALLAALFIAHPLAALIVPLYVLAYAIIGFALVSVVRFLRNH